MSVQTEPDFGDEVAELQDLTARLGSSLRSWERGWDWAVIGGQVEPVLVDITQAAVDSRWYLDRILESRQARRKGCSA